MTLTAPDAIRVSAQGDMAEFVRRFWPADDDLPKHGKLRRAIGDAIAARFWPAGARLPTEAEWVAALPCSLGTVQRALRELVVDGLIARRRGSGSVVAGIGRRIEEPWHMRFFDPKSRTRTLLPVTTTILGRWVGPRSGPWSDELGQGERPVVCIERIMEVGGAFGVFNRFYALAEQFPELVDISTEDLRGANLKTLMASRHHVPVHHVRQVMRFEAPPARAVKACGWADDRPVSVLNVVGCAHDGGPMYYQDYFIPVTRYRLDLGAPTSP